MAERVGFDHDEALTLGRAIAGLSAQAKGKRLGLFRPSSTSIKEAREEQAKNLIVELMHRAVPVIVTVDGIRATAKGKPTNPASVVKYLASKFGDHLEPVSRAMVELSKSYGPEELADVACKLYEHFRPSVPEGTQGWGAAGALELSRKRGAGPDK